MSALQGGMQPVPHTWLPPTGDSSGCRCQSSRGGALHLPEDDEEQSGQASDEQPGAITTSQPKWSAVAALQAT